MSQYVRGGLSARAVSRTDNHLADCAECAAAVLQVEQTNRKLAALLLPIVLIGGASRLDLAAAAGGSALGSVRRLTSHAGAPAVATAAVGVVALTCVAALALWPSGDAPGERPGRDDSPAARVPDQTAPRPLPDTAGPADPAVRPVGATVTPAPLVPVDAEDGPGPEGPARPPAAEPVVVTPVAPTATPVTSCGTYGSLSAPTTEGVRYVRTKGDGRSGPWAVRAEARAGHVIAGGAPTRFTGDLGAFVACPAFTDVTRTNTGGTLWSVSADVEASGAGSYTVGVELRFDVIVFTGGFSGAGWSCFATDEDDTRRALDGTDYQLQPGQQWIVCEHSYAGADPAPVEVSVDTVLPGDPSGTATLRSEGVVRAERSF